MYYQEVLAEIEGKALVKVWLENEAIQHETYVIGKGLVSSSYETPPVEWGIGEIIWNFEPEDIRLKFPEDYEGLIKFEIIKPVEWDFYKMGAY